MRMRVSLVVGACLLAFASAYLAQSSGPLLRFQPPLRTVFRLTYKESQTDLLYRPRVRNEPPIQPSRFAPRDVTDKEIGLDWRVLDIGPDGNTRIEMSYAYLKVTLTKNKLVDEFSGEVTYPGEAYTFDTRIDVFDSNPGLQKGLENADKTKAAQLETVVDFLRSARTALREGAIGRKFTVSISPDAKVVAVMGMEQLMDEYRTAISKKDVDPAVRARQDAMLEAYFGEDQISRTLSDTILLALPNRVVKLGDSWSDRSEAKTFGLTIPVVRKFKVASISPSEIKVDATRETTLSASRNGNSITSTGAFKFSASIDPATGLAESVAMTGTDESVVFPDGGLPTQPLAFENFVFSGSYRLVKMGMLAEGSKDEWTLNDEGGRYSVTLGPGWTRTFGLSVIAGITSSGFDRSVDERSLRASYRMVAADAATKFPLSQHATRVLKIYADKTRSTAKLLSSKHVKIGGSDRARTNYMVTWSDGHIRTHWSEFAYAAGREFNFEASYAGPPDIEADKEIVRILDSIRIPALSKR